MPSPLEQYDLIYFFSGIFGLFYYPNFIIINIIIILFFIGYLFFFNKELSLIFTFWQFFFENLFIFVCHIVKQQIGLKGYIYVPLIVTFFLLILCANFLSLTPFSVALTSHISIVLWMTFIINLGIFLQGFVSNQLKFLKLFVPESPLLLLILLIPIEIFSYSIRSLSMGIRSTANIIAGHTLVFIISNFLLNILVLKLLFFFFFLIFLFFIFILEIGVAFLQAYVFIVLFCIILMIVWIYQIIKLYKFMLFFLYNFLFILINFRMYLKIKLFFMKLYKFIFKKFLKIFSFGVALCAGRNSFGRVCVQHQGGGVKANYINIDRYRYLNQYGFVFRIIQNFFRSGFIGFIIYDNGLTSFILLTENLFKGSRLFSGNNKIFLFFNIKFGSTQKLLNINLFETINAIELFPFSGAKLVRSAGCGAKIISKNTNQALLKLNSGWQIKISNHSLASIGLVSNIFLKYKVIGKAGLNRKKGVRPTVRGVIKNPCDHPHGGGEGKGSPPVAQVSPWGWLCKGTPSKKKKIDKLYKILYKKI